jgi:7-cyano-7-deazaguanine synthase in queuosine biosynthesis
VLPYVVAPFIKTSRKDLIGLAYIMDKNIFENSMTCWTPRNENNCGECKHCILQKELIECIIPMTVYKKLNMYELVFNYTVKDLMTKAFNGEY